MFVSPYFASYGILCATGVSIGMGDRSRDCDDRDGGSDDVFTCGGFCDDPGEDVGDGVMVFLFFLCVVCGARRSVCGCACWSTQIKRIQQQQRMKSNTGRDHRNVCIYEIPSISART